MKKRKKIIWFSLILMAIIAIAAGVYYYTAKPAPQTNQQIAMVEYRDLQSDIAATGTIRPVNSVAVSSKITARIKEILVHENERVTKGQILAILDGKDYESQLEQAKYNLENARQKYNRMAELLQSGAISREAYDDAKYKYDIAQSQYAETQSNLSETVIRAPMAGVVIGNPISVGSMAVQGTSNPTVIMTIADLAHKEIVAKIDETDISKVKLGQMATFTVDAYKDKIFKASVQKISQTDVGNTWDNDSSSQGNNVIYYNVTLKILGDENELLPAMTAHLNLNIATKKHVLTTPLATLKNDKKGIYVMLEQADGSFKQQYVQTGIYGDEYVEILSGLKEGDKVAYTMPNSEPSDGRPPRRH